MPKVSEFELEFSKGPLGFTVESPPQSGKPGAVVTRITDDKLKKKLKIQSTILKVNGKSVTDLPLSEIVGQLKKIITSKKWPLRVTFRSPRDHMAGGKTKKSPRKNKRQPKPNKRANNRDRQSGERDGRQQGSQEPSQNQGQDAPENAQNQNGRSKNNRRKGRGRQGQGPSLQQQNDGANGRGNNQRRQRQSNQNGTPPNQNGTKQNGNRPRNPQNQQKPRPNNQGKVPQTQNIYQEGDRVQGMGSGNYKGKWFPGTITSVKFEHKNDQYQYTIEYDQTKGKEYTIRARHLRLLETATAGTAPAGAGAPKGLPTNVEGSPAPPDKDVPTRLKFIYYGSYGTNVPTEKVAELTADEDGLYSITHAAIANMQSNILASFSPALPQQITITDGTAGLGGNTHSFAKFFRFVRAVEIDKDRFEKLQNNMAILCRLGGIEKKAECIHGDVLEVVKRTKDSNILFLDGPWMKDFREKPVLDISITNTEGGKISIPQVCNQIRQSNPEVELIGLKLPFNYDQDYLLRTVYGCNIAEFQFSYTRIRNREDISQVLVVLDYHHNSKDFSLIFSGVQQRNRYVNAEILRRKTFVDSKEVEMALAKMSKELQSSLRPVAKNFQPNNKRHALRGEVEMLD